MSDDAAAGPDGIPIGRALEIPDGLINDDLRRAAAIVGRIHGDGVLPPVPLRMTRLAAGANGRRVPRGRFAVDPETGQPISILIDVGEEHRTFTTIHEIGHYLDLCGIGSPARFVSPDEPSMDGWRQMIRRSQAIQRLIELSQDASDLVDQAHVAELLDPVEAWARCYAQYITRRSDDSRLQAAVDAFRTRHSSGVYYPYQWDDDDFDATDEAIERLFRRLGWRSEQPL